MSSKDELSYNEVQSMLAFGAARILSENLEDDKPITLVRTPLFKAHRLVYHSTLGWRVIKKKRKKPITLVRPASERRGNNLKGFTEFYLKVKARIWP